MWVSFEVIPSNYKILVLPQQTIKMLNDSVYIIFGERSSYCYLQYSRHQENRDYSFDNPYKAQISSALKDELLIPDSQIYQVKVDANRITIGPVIGLLLGNHNYLYNPRHMEKYSDRFGIYNKVGGLIYAFTPKTIDWKKNMAYGIYYNIKRSKWEYGVFPLPSVIYRRNFHSDPKTIKKLINITNNRMFNSFRFTKFELYKILETNEYLAKHLPPTETSDSYNQVKAFIDKHEFTILKPVDLSRGRGICIIDKVNSGYRINDYRSRNPQELFFSSDKELEKFFTMNQCFFNKYIIQKQISLAQIDNCRFDIRVVMQKNDSLIWQCTGIECRVGGDSSLVTNIARGGYALSLEEALEKSFVKQTNYDLIIDEINNLSLKLCEHLDSIGEHFAEFGMDIAIDKNKKLWIIEVNVFPSFKGFKTMNYSTYLSIRHTPLLYALALTDFSGSKKSQE